MPFTNTWDEAKPAGTDAIALGDDQIRQAKLDIRERINVEHDFPSATGNLRHKFGYGTTVQRDAITDWVVGSLWFNTNVFAGVTTVQIVTAVGPVTWLSIAVIDHGFLSGLADDDHTQYILAAGTRAFTGDQSMGSKNLTNVLDPTSNQHAATKKYVDDNKTLVGARGQASSGNIIVAPASMADMTDMSVTVTTNGKPVLIEFNVTINPVGVNGGATFQLLIDGVVKCAGQAQGNNVGVKTALSLNWLEIGLSAASHVFKVQWERIASATETPSLATNRVLTVVEQTQVTT